jgi:hypothetical protein
MAGVLLAVLAILFPVTQAKAQDIVDCPTSTLSAVKVNTTLTVGVGDRTYPHLKSTTDYEIPLNWPGVAALQGKPGDSGYDAALRCFIVSWGEEKISQSGEYRQQLPVVQIKDAMPAAKGKEATPPQIILHDEVTGDLIRSTTPPLLGPWKVTLESGYARFKLIAKDPSRLPEDPDPLLPGAFDSMIWTPTVKLLSDFRFHQLEPKPVSTDGEREASWAFHAGAESGKLLASVKLDIPARIAIASDSGWLDAFSYVFYAFVDAPVYLAILFLTRRKFLVTISASNDAVNLGVCSARWISRFGLVLGTLKFAAYYLYGKGNHFNGTGMPVAYWTWSGFIGILIVGLIIALFIIRAKVKFSFLVLLGLVSFFGASIFILFLPEELNLRQDFSPIKSPSTLIEKGILSQFALMATLTCAALFVALTILHFAFHAVRTFAWQRLADRPAPLFSLWKYLALSSIVSLALMVQWAWQQVESWNRNHVFPVEEAARHSQLTTNVTSRMITYYRDFLVELAVNLVQWAAIAAVIFTLCCVGRDARRTRPSEWEYRALGLLFSAIVVKTGSWYVGFTFPIDFIIAFIIVAYAPSWVTRFNQLEKIHVGNSSGNTRKTLLDVLPKLENPRSLLVTLQTRMDVLRDRARSLDSDLSSGKMQVDEHSVQRKKIEFSLSDCQVIQESNMTRKVFTNGSIKSLKLPQDVRPADGALAIGPCSDWLENGVLGAKFVVWPSLLVTAFFCYVHIGDGIFSPANSYLGTLRLLSYAVWQFGFWVAAAFVLGCLWTTLPGRLGPIKGLALGIGFALPFVVNFALGWILHQKLLPGALLHFMLILLELLAVGLAMDWFTLRKADPLRIINWQSLAALYGVRRLVPILATVVPLLTALIGIYLEIKSWGTWDVLRVPAIPLQSDSRLGK